MFKAGDIIGFSGAGIVSDVINLATQGIPRWNLSHVGVVADYGDRLLLFESTSLRDDPCAISGRRTKGVQAAELDSLVKRDGKVWHYSLYRELDETARLHLSKYLVSKLGVHYDYAGAVESGGILLRFLAHFLHGEDLNELFCSELAAHAFDIAGIIPTSDASSYSPNAFVRRCRRQGILLKRMRMK